ncbi:MAG: HAD family phosphatase [Ruminococcus sp.]|nr:HAD family phosphatase [Ruminococcus sp.]
MKLLQNPVNGIIFDLDGTLIDSMTIWCRIDREFLRENGVDDPPADISDRIKKMTVDQSSQYFIDEFGLDLTKQQVIDRIEELVRIEYMEKIQLKPYAYELLEYVSEKNIPCGVATATYKPLAEGVLKRCGIYDRFRFLFTDNEYPKGKNFPDIFLGGAEKLGTSPHETLVIEDSLHCIKTASGAGFITAGVYDEVSSADKGEIESIADIYVDSLYDLKNIM